ncbi:nickel pincer cofactor biosynthesis protein LarC [Liquorilactobacillus vini]|uniref:nickel pincer cofactor biosynthesis protein LarC n=1 Tax=Liquorilactobacillus vini TaxID=238015 RepID=UPI0003020BCB|nr:nickel pincer cofactor biosynthesis protein LarC [Liquorilactobacillus vini]
MKRILFIDCNYGISGDMLLSSLIDLGIDLNLLKDQLRKVVNFDFQMSVQESEQKSISAKRMLLKFKLPNVEKSISQHQHHIHNHYHHIKEMISNAKGIDEKGKQMSLAVFKTIAQAESKIHNTPLEKVAFHEVGATDSIIDIVGNCLAIASLKVDEIITTSVPTGFGKINVQHGLYPVPAPATLEILKGVPLSDFAVEGELTTPTGAAIIKTLTNKFSNTISGKIVKVGYGSGTHVFEHPNILRTMLVEVPTEQLNNIPSDKKLMLSCQVDDMTGENLGYVMKQAFSKGADDFVYIPVYMKKNRPAVELSLLCSVKDEFKFEKFLLENTSTFGIRKQVVDRKILKRDFSNIEIKGEKIKVKRGWLNGKIIKITPEYESLKRLAEKKNLPFNNLYQEAVSIINAGFLS